LKGHTYRPKTLCGVKNESFRLPKVEIPRPEYSRGLESFAKGAEEENCQLLGKRCTKERSRDVSFFQLRPLKTDPKPYFRAGGENCICKSSGKTFAPQVQVDCDLIEGRRVAVPPNLKGSGESKYRHKKNRPRRRRTIRRSSVARRHKASWAANIEFTIVDRPKRPKFESSSSVSERGAGSCRGRMSPVTVSSI